MGRVPFSLIQPAVPSLSLSRSHSAMEFMLTCDVLMTHTRGRPFPDVTNPFTKFIEQRDQAERMKMKMDLKREKKALKKKSKGL